MVVPSAAPAATDPTLPGGPLPAGTTEKFLEANGVRIRFLDGGTPGGDPVLFLHGWPTWAEVWNHITPLVPAGRRWIAVDLPNHGKSGALPGKGASLTGLRQAMVSLFDTLSLDRCAVVGCSIGGTLAVMMALDRPDKVQKIVAIDAAGFAAKIPGKTVRMYLPFFIRCMFGKPSAKAVRKLLLKAVFHNPDAVSEAWVNAVTAGWKPKERRKALLAIGGALRKPDASVGARVRDVRCPALIVWGKNDTQFKWQIGEAAARGMQNAKFVGIENCGHFPMVEQPQATAEAVIPFLSA